jgi:hypothetical protein
MIYGVNSVRYIGNLEELLEISHKENLLEHLFVLGSGEDIISGDLDTQRVQVSRESPVRYQVDEMTAAYLLGTGYLGKSRTLWEYGQGAQMYNLGVVPAFAASRDSQALTYTRFYRVYWPSGVLSLVMLLVLAGWLVFGMLRKSI